MERLSSVTQQIDIQTKARDFVIGLLCQVAGRGFLADTVAELGRRLGPTAGYTTAFRKAAVDPIGATPGELAPWGFAFLRGRVAERSALDFLDFARVPEFVRIAISNGADPEPAWIPEGFAIPVAALSLDFETVIPRKVGLIEVFTAELLRAPGAEPIATVSRQLAEVIAKATDSLAFDPAVTDSLTIGAPEITPTAGTVGDTIAALLGAIAGGTAGRPVLVLGSGAARRLVFSGDPIFRDVGLAGPGRLGGVPTFTSAAAAIELLAVAIDLDGVLVADLGLDVVPSTDAAIQMNTTPDSPTTATSVVRSFWQEDLVGIRATRRLGWARRDDAIAYAHILTQSP